MKPVKSKQSAHFALKNSLRDCGMSMGAGPAHMADGGSTRDLLANRGKQIDAAVDAAQTSGPAPAPAPAAPVPQQPMDPLSAQLAAAAAQRAAAKPAPPAKKPGVFGLGFLGLRDGGEATVDILRNRGRHIDEAVDEAQGAKPANSVPAPAPAPETPPPQQLPASRYPRRTDIAKRPGLLGLGVLGLRDGGFLGDDGDAVPGRAIDPKTFARGGPVSGPGGPTEDKIPAMLSDGEYVLPADTVRHVGKENLDQLKDATHKPTLRNFDGDRAPHPVHDPIAAPMHTFMQQPHAQPQGLANGGMAGMPEPGSDEETRQIGQLVVNTPATLRNPLGFQNRQDLQQSKLPRLSTGTIDGGNNPGMHQVNPNSMALLDQLNGAVTPPPAPTEWQPGMSQDVNRPSLTMPPPTQQAPTQVSAPGSYGMNDRGAGDTGAAINARQGTAMMDRDAALQPGITSGGTGLRGFGNVFSGQGQDQGELQAGLQRAAQAKYDLGNAVQGRIATGDLDGANNVAATSDQRLAVDQAYAARKDRTYQKASESVAAREKAAGLQSQIDSIRKSNAGAADKNAAIQHVYDTQQQGETARAQNAVSLRGQDISSRGQDMQARTAANEQQVQLHGQNLANNLGLINAHRAAAMEQARFGLDTQKFGLDKAKTYADERRAGQNQYTAALEKYTGVNEKDAPKGVRDTHNAMDLKIQDTLGQLGMTPGDVPASMLPELFQKASEATKSDQGQIGGGAWLKRLVGLQNENQSSTNLRNYEPNGIELGALGDDVKRGVGRLDEDRYQRGDQTQGWTAPWNREPVKLERAKALSSQYESLRKKPE